MAASGYSPISLYYSTTASATPTNTNLVNGELAINITDGKLFYKDNSGTVQTLSQKSDVITPITNNGIVYVNSSGQATSGTALSFNGTSLTFGTTSQRIIGDMSNATQANRLFAQTSTLNSSTSFGVLPNGSSVTSQFTAYGSSDPTNATRMRVGIDGSGVYLISDITGTGSYLPLRFVTDGAEGMRLTSSLLTVVPGALIQGITVGRGAGAVVGNNALGTSALAANTTGYDNTAVGYSAMLLNQDGIRNTALGSFALQANTSGGYNVAVGRQTANGTTSGAYNTAVGWAALFTNSTGNYSVAIGEEALYSYSGSGLSVAIGAQALRSATTPTAATAIGYQALYSNTTGDSNTAVGRAALYSNTTASNNTAVGYQAGYSNTTGAQNTFIGLTAGYSNTTGSYSTAVGWESLKANTTGRNTAYGIRSLFANTTGSANTALGDNAMGVNTTGDSNTAVGYSALEKNTTASNNTAVGYQAGYSNTTSSEATYVGNQAGYSVTTGVSNTFIGRQAGYSVTTGYANTFIGGGWSGNNLASGYYVTTGARNTILGNYNGNQGGLDIRTASNYIVLSDGDGNPRGIFDSSGNLGIGTSSPSSKLHLYSALGTAQITQDAGTAFRVISNNGLNYIQSGTALSSDSKAPLVFTSMYGVTEWMRIDTSGNLLVGTTTATGKASIAGAITATASSALVNPSVGVFGLYTGGAIPNTYIQMPSGGSIDFWKADTSVAARIDSSGNFLVAKTSNSATTVGGQMNVDGAITSARASSVNGDLTWYTYSTTAAAARFYVGMGGTVYATSTTITAISDRRLKENIQDIDVGLNAIMALKPRKFDWKDGKGKNKKGDRGWIAQEFEQVFPDMIDTWADPAPEGEEPYKAVNADLIPVLVKAIQEQQAIIETLTARVAALESK